MHLNTESLSLVRTMINIVIVLAEFLRNW